MALTTQDLEAPLEDVFERLATAPRRGPDQPAGTVLAADGTLVTLGRTGGRNTFFTTPRSGSNYSRSK